MRIEVLLDIPRPADDPFFSYEVPPHLRSRIKPGQRVLVPLGHQVVRGFVMRIGCNDGPDSLKPALEILEEEPLLAPDMLALAEWLAEYYLAPLHRVVKAMLPTALDDSEKEILVSTGGESLPPDLQARLGSSWKDDRRGFTAQELIKMLGQGQVKVEAAGVPEIHDASVQYALSPAVTKDTVSRLAKKAPRQAKALKYFMERKDPVLERQALENCSLSVLNRLVEKGWLERREATAKLRQDPLPNQEQAYAIQRIEHGLAEREGRAFLLFGVTGSGKTEVYLRSVERARSLGRQSLVLIPEIGLTQQIISIFEERLGPRISVLHSRLTDAQRALEWLRVKKGLADVVIGARSAVFAPFPNLGLIIIDEEQETSFHQDETPRYHAREVALKRAELSDAVLVLGSATPSMETYHRAETGQYEMLRLSHKIASSGQRSIKVVDIKKSCRQGNQIISPEMLTDIKQCVESGNQAIIFINRRGYATTVLCPHCGLVLTCHSCEVALNFHRDVSRMVCHYCGHERSVPGKCPRCKESRLRFMGTGSQKVEEELRNLLPGVRIIRMDTDSTRTRDGHAKIIDSIRNRKVDIAVGTQMIAKGFDFPGVALVGVINADPLLGLPDFRARERAFQLLVQVAGRAGRGAAKGQVTIQTLEPDSSFFDLVRTEDYEGFYRQEIFSRLALGYPPFSHVIKLLFSGVIEETVREEADFSRMLIEEMVGEEGDGIDILGPAPCLRPKIKNRYRIQMLLKGSRLDLMRNITKYIINRELPRGVRLDVDLDPVVMI